MSREPSFDPSVRERFTGIALGVLSVALFSGFTLASRLGLSSSLKFPDLAALRFGIGGTLLLPVLLRHGLGGTRLPRAATLALLGGLGFALLAYAGFSLAPAAHGAVLLHGTIPLFTWLMTAATDAEAAPDTRRRLGIGVIAIGVALMACDSLVAARPRQLLGDGLLLLASISWSAYGVLSRRWRLPPAQGAAIVAVVSMAAFLPIYLMLPGKAVFLLSSRALLLQAFVQGVLIGAVSIFVYTRAVAALGAAETALFTAAVPCITTLAGIPLLCEVPNGRAWAGVASVTLGLVLSIRQQRVTVSSRHRNESRAASPATRQTETTRVTCQ